MLPAKDSLRIAVLDFNKTKWMFDNAKPAVLSDVAANLYKVLRYKCPIYPRTDIL
jgi:hypothetical protein